MDEKIKRNSLRCFSMTYPGYHEKCVTKASAYERRKTNLKTGLYEVNNVSKQNGTHKTYRPAMAGNASGISRSKPNKNKLLSRKRFHTKFMTLLIFLFIYHVQISEAHEMDQSEDTLASPNLHRRLGKRERREVQKEILSVFGLSHRPRPDGEPARGFQRESAPLYMLGLYNTVSGFSEIFRKRIQQDFLPATSNPSIPQKRESPPSGRQLNINSPLSHRKYSSVGPFSDAWPYDIRVATNSAYYRYGEAERTFFNEVGTPENEAEGFHSEGATVEQRLLGNADVVMSFIAHNNRGYDDDEALRGQHLRRHRSFFFKLDQIPREDDLTGARFRLYKNISREFPDITTLRVNVYQAKHNPPGQLTLELVSSVRVWSNQTGWLAFNVLDACAEWLKNSSKNLGLRVTVETLEGRSINLNKAGIVGKKGDSSKKAFLVVFLTQGSKSLPSKLRRRIKRNAMPRDTAALDENILTDDEDESEDEPVALQQSVTSESSAQDNKRIKRARKDQRKSKSGRSRSRKGNRIRYDRGGNDACHREELYVNFQDLNWDAWIIAPAGYSAYHCMGLCQFPLNANMNATNHAIVQTLVHLMNPDKLRQPCCSPTKLDPISVLYYDDDNNVVYKKYKEMVVNACGCH